jgi:hypothetical protein
LRIVHAIGGLAMLPGVAGSNSRVTEPQLQTIRSIRSFTSPMEFKFPLTNEGNARISFAMISRNSFKNIVHYVFYTYNKITCN